MNPQEPQNPNSWSVPEPQPTDAGTPPSPMSAPAPTPVSPLSSNPLNSLNAASEASASSHASTASTPEVNLESSSSVPQSTPSEAPAPVMQPLVSVVPILSAAPTADAPAPASQQAVPSSNLPVADPTPSAPATATPGIVIGSAGSSPVTMSPTGQVMFDGGRNGHRSKMKFTLAAATTVVVLLVGTGGYVFGYAIPNKPENIWKTALTRTGKGYDGLVTYASTDTKVKDWTGHLSYQMKGSAASDGSFDAKFNDKAAQLTGSISAAGMKVGLDVRAIPSTGTNPDLYIKASGIQGLGGLLGEGNPQLTQTLNSINNQWYVVDHSLFDQLSQTSASKDQITTQDITDLAKAIGKTNKQYIFTDDTTKQAVVMKEKLGHETRDGRSVYHFKAGFDKANLKAYLSAVCGNFKASKLGKQYDPSGSFIDCTEATKSVDNLKDSDTADVWVDMKTKLVHSVQIVDSSDSKNTVEIAQNYTGGTEFPFKITVSDQNGSSMQIGLSVNTKTNVSSFNLAADSGTGTGTGKTTVSINGSVQPSSTPTKVETPANAKSIIELANDLGIGSFFSGASSATESSAFTTSMKTKITDTTAKKTLATIGTNWQCVHAKTCSPSYALTAFVKQEK